MSEVWSEVLAQEFANDAILSTPTLRRILFATNKNINFITIVHGNLAYIGVSRCVVITRYA